MPDRRQSLADAAREYIWLYDRRHGLTLQAIADASHVSIGRVRAGLARAEAAEAAPDPVPNPLRLVPPRLMPLFPVGSYTPLSDCPHHGAIRPGSILCCMVCHQTGQDAHPALQRDGKTDPVPDSKPTTMGPPDPQTRKARRARMQAAKTTVLPPIADGGRLDRA